MSPSRSHFRLQAIQRIATQGNAPVTGCYILVVTTAARKVYDVGKPRTAFTVSIILTLILVACPPIVVHAASSPASSYITVRSPSTTGPFEGTVSLQGISSLSTIWVWLRDPGWQVQVFPVECSGGMFQTTLFMRSGPGIYEVLLSQVSGEFDGTVRLLLTNTQSADRRYAMPSAFVDSNHSAILGLVKSVILPGMTEAQKARAIYDWVTRNISYDVAEYLSGSEEAAQASQTLRLGYGTCRDYALLVAALSRAAGLQAKVVFGYATPVRVPIMHAWNEILVDGEWISMDATLGAGYVTNWRFVRNPTAKYYGLSPATHVVKVIAPD